MPERICQKCHKAYSTRQSLSVHMKKCNGKKRGVGRPKKEPALKDTNDEYDVSDGDEGDVLMPLPKKTKMTSWNSTFEKAKKLLEDKVPENEITMAIKYDNCFQDGIILKRQLEAKLKSVQDPHRLTKQKINRDFRTLDENKKEQLKSIVEC